MEAVKKSACKPTQAKDGAEKRSVRTAPYGRGSVCRCKRLVSILSRDHRERFVSIFQHCLKAVLNPADITCQTDPNLVSGERSPGHKPASSDSFGPTARHRSSLNSVRGVRRPRASLKGP